MHVDLFMLPDRLNPSYVFLSMLTEEATLCLHRSMYVKRLNSGYVGLCLFTEEAELSMFKPMSVH